MCWSNQLWVLLLLRSLVLKHAKDKCEFLALIPHSPVLYTVCTSNKLVCAVLWGVGFWMGIDNCSPAGFEYLAPFLSVQLILKKALKANKTEGSYSLLVWGCKGLTAARAHRPVLWQLSNLGFIRETQTGN